DLQLCLGFTECNQSCPCPIGRPYQRLWAPQTTRMQGTTWVQRQINSNSLIFEPPTCVATQPHKLVAQISGQNFGHPRQNLTPRFLEKLAALRKTPRPCDRISCNTQSGTGALFGKEER